MTRDTRIAVNLSCVSGLMVAAAFMTWGRVAAEAATDKFAVGNEVTGAALSLFGSKLSIPISGWIGSVSAGGLELANWLPALAVVAATVLTWLRACRVTRVPLSIMALLLLYAGAHLALVFSVLRGVDAASLGIGWFVSVLAVALGLFALAPPLAVADSTGVE